ncbi:MAG: hypothetical protein R2912_03300 [Eubacteriales bacterium]
MMLQLMAAQHSIDELDDANGDDAEGPQLPAPSGRICAPRLASIGNS